MMPSNTFKRQFNWLQNIRCLQQFRECPASFRSVVGSHRQLSARIGTETRFPAGSIQPWTCAGTKRRLASCCPALRTGTQIKIRLAGSPCQSRPRSGQNRPPRRRNYSIATSVRSKSERRLCPVLARLGITSTRSIADAIAHLQRALQLQPNYVQASISLAMAYKRANRPTDAIAAGQKACGNGSCNGPN